MREKKAGTTSYMTHIFIQDETSTTGAGKTGLDNGDISIYWIRPGDTGATAAGAINTIGTISTTDIVRTIIIVITITVATITVAKNDRNSLCHRQRELLICLLLMHQLNHIPIHSLRKIDCIFPDQHLAFLHAFRLRSFPA